MRGYEAKAHEKAGVELRKADNHWNTISQLLAEVKEKCDGGGFMAFQSKYCPDLGRSRIYELLAIGSGKKTLEESRAEKRKRVTKSRGNVSVTSDVADKPPKVQPTMSRKERGTFVATRERAHEIGCRLSRHGKKYDLTQDGGVVRYSNLDVVSHVLDIIEGKLLTVVGDECMNNPGSLQKEMNAEEAKAYAAARKGKTHERLPALSEFKRAVDDWLPKLTTSERAVAVEYVRSFFAEEAETTVH
jgi:hypothetical protein